jgi:hypothetical protein
LHEDERSDELPSRLGQRQASLLPAAFAITRLARLAADTRTAVHRAGVATQPLEADAETATRTSRC